MKGYLKSYQVSLRTVGPVFIGSGQEIGKKEYIFLNRKQVGLPDMQRLYGELKKRKLSEDFEKYMLDNGNMNNMNLNDWLSRKNIKIEEIKPYIKYMLDCGDAILEKGAGRLQVMACMKDAYGKPYIPGSSLKGMFRSALLGADILKEPGKYREAGKKMRQNAEKKGNRNYYLKQDSAGLEGIAFRTLSRNEKNSLDAVNDSLHGLILSDSAPLREDDLVLCQKVDVHTDGMERLLPLLRECIKPGVEIRFTVTVDGEACPLTKESLLNAVNIFMKNCNENFIAAFPVPTVPETGYLFLGGGCGFVSKTVVYPLYGKEEGMSFTQNVFAETGVPAQHKHRQDKAYGASPHTLKCTRYQGQMMQMGLCRIEKMVLME